MPLYSWKKRKSQTKKRYWEEWKIVKDDKKASEDWLEDLIINSKDAWGMWCKACTKFAPKMGIKSCSNFVKGHENFKPPHPKIETICHFSSSAHFKCAEMAKVSQQPAEAALAYQKLIEMDTKTKKKMENRMRIVFYFAMKDRAAKEFSSECDLQKMNGANLGKTYQNEMLFKVLLKYIALSFQKKIISQIN